jgi:hypothetical protein
MHSSSTLAAVVPFDAYVRPTKYCTSHHPVISQMTRVVVGDHRCERTIAVRLFEWVRDHIQYRVGDWNRQAWETALAADGTCTNKANLLVAMLRAAGIPAGYRVMKVDATKYWGIGVPSWVCQGFSRYSSHTYVSCLVEGRWLRCDPSDDRVLCENVAHLNPLSRLVVFDGASDAVLPFAPEHVHSDEGVFPSIDHILSKQRRAASAQVEMMNLMLSYARRVGRAYSDLPAIQAAFFEHVRTEAPDLLERFYASFEQHSSIPAPPKSSPRVSTRLRVAAKRL